MRRRDFHKLCTGMIACAGASGKVQALGPREQHNPVHLVDGDNNKLRAADIAAGESWVCFYPYVTTPCFVINLAEQDSSTPGDNIVAFAAICTHKLSHPAKEMSFITYRPPTEAAPLHRVVCCSEGSVYDAANGARVLGGPAPAPLARIELKEDDNGYLLATASHAGNLYQRFFDAFSFRLALDYGVENPQTLATNTTVVRTLAEHSKHHIECF